MHWQKACLISKEKKAIRKTLDGRTIIRHWDGSGIIKKSLHAQYDDNPYRKARTEELEGYLDWEPLE